MYFYRKVLNVVYSRLQKRIEINSRRKEHMPGNWIYMLHSVLERENEICGREYTISPDSFEQFISAIPKHRIDHIYELEDKSTNEKVFITFDDGYEDVFLNAYPILKKHEIPFCVFVIADFIGQNGYMTVEQLKELQAEPLCTLAAHTLRHSILRLLTNKECENEIINGKHKLEEMLKDEVRYFAYPYGSITKVGLREIRFVRRAGYSLAFSTINSKYYQHNPREKYYIPRININDGNYLEMLRRIEK